MFLWFYSNREIAEMISEFPDSDKVLIFVSSIAEGKEIKSQLIKLIPKGCGNFAPKIQRI